MQVRSGNWAQSQIAVYERHLIDALYTASKSRLLRIAVLVFALGVAAFTLYQRFTPESTLPCYPDFYSFYHSALDLRGGTAPYGPVAAWLRTNVPSTVSGPFTATSCLSGLYEFSYTPFLGLLFIPFTVLPYTLALLLWDGCNLLLLGGAIYAFLRAAGIRPSALHLVLLTVAATFIGPMRFMLYYTQADLLVVFCICAALWARLAGRPLLAGLLLAVPCAIEPTLLVFVAPFLLWKREYRLAAVASVTAVVFIFAPFLWLGGQALQDLLVIWRFDWGLHSVSYFNNAPRGILLRVLTLNEYVKPLANAPGLVTPLWLLLALVVLLAAARVISRRPLAGDSRSLLDIGLAVAAALLVSPWSENNHFTLLLLPFLAVYVCLWRIGVATPVARPLLWGFVVAFVFALLLGDPVQYAMLARMGTDSPIRLLYVLLAVPYLYTLLAIATLTVYARSFVTGAGAPDSAVAPSMAASASSSHVQGDAIPAHVQRVHIIGGPGSGKSSLSLRIAASLGVPAFELDEIAGTGPPPDFQMLQPLSERLEVVRHIASLPGWVTEGSFLWWTDDLLSTADCIIWLDLPPRTAMRRVIARYNLRGQVHSYLAKVMAQSSFAGKARALRQPHIVPVASFIRYTWAYYHRAERTKPLRSEDLNDGWALTRTETAAQLEHYRGKVIRCIRPEDVARILVSFAKLHPATPKGSTTMDTGYQEAPSASSVSAYAELNKAAWVPSNYDENIYNPAGYDTFVWELYKPHLLRIVEDLVRQREHTKYLDFACGTGRIIAALEECFTESAGLDISQPMIEYAQYKAPRSELLCGDILSQPDVVAFNYDVITAFRFFLNTEPEMRTLVMHSLASRLADENSRLIFNIHMNRWGVDRLKSLYSRLRGWGSRTTVSYPMVRRLVEDAGLEIEAWYGFALWPDRLYRGRLSPLVRQLDRWTANIRPLRWISKDMLFVCRKRVDGAQAS